MADADLMGDYAPQLPATATRVTRRSLVLAAVICRGALESNAEQPEADTLQTSVLDWLTKFGLWDEVESSEEKILRTLLGKLEKKDTIQATWYAEGLVILSWALKQWEFPRHDQQVDSPEVADSVWFLSEDADELIRTAMLRSPAELEACRELLYAIHSRLRDFIRYRNSKDFTSWVEQTWIDVLDLDVTHLIVDNDLAIDDKPISQATEEQLQECANITFERHRAIVWLVEGYPSYSQTPVDT